MRMFIRNQVRPAIGIIVVMTFLTGVIYPVLVTTAAQVVFPAQANGSLIRGADGVVLGSRLIGQAFSDPSYFWSRPSVAGIDGYDATASAGSNLGPTSRVLVERVTSSAQRLRLQHGEGPVPVDLVTTSASGLDPHISPSAAEYQVVRVAGARDLSEGDVRALVARHTVQPLLGFIGQPAVNVLELNLDLDGRLP